MDGYFEIVEKRTDDVDIATVRGRLDAGSSKTARERISSVLDAGGRNLLVNLCDLDDISSSGLRVLLAALKQLKADDGVPFDPLTAPPPLLDVPVEERPESP